MNVEWSLALNVVAFMATLARVSAFLLAAPIFSGQQIPGRLRLLTAMVLSLVMMPLLPESWPAVLRGAGAFDLTLLLAGEALLGLTVALVIRLLQEAVVLGGTLMGRDLGYAMAQMVDPSLEGQRPVLSVLLLQVFSMIFLAVNGHLELLRVVARSLWTVAPGSFRVGEGAVLDVLAVSSQLFLFAFRLALPIFGLLLLINVAMALMSKFGQEFEVMMLSFPIRLGVGLLVLAAMTPVLVQMLAGLVAELPEWLLSLTG